MQKYFIEKHNVYGFDLDGTLYDEFDFINQVYEPIAEYIACNVKHNKNHVYQVICAKWMMYGSSKPDLFQSFFLDFGIEPKEEHIRKCINLYRTSNFKLILPARVIAILNHLKNSKAEFFLFTDGNSDLQRKKLQSLNLYSFFKHNEIFISGDYGKDYQKPSVKINEVIMEQIKDLADVLYSGDRIVDKEYAISSGYAFQKVHCMICETN